MNPTQGFQTRQNLLQEIEGAQEDKKLAQKTLDQKTFNRDALEKGVKALPGLQAECQGTSLARHVDLKTDALREEIAKDRLALEAAKKEAKEEAARREKQRKDEEAARKKKEIEESRRKAEEEKKRLESLSQQERELEAKKKQEEKKRAAEEAKKLKEQQPEPPKLKIEVPEREDPFAERERAINEKRDRLDALNAVQKLLQPEPWMEDPLARAKLALEEAQKDVLKAQEALASKTSALEGAETRYKPYVEAVPGAKPQQADESFYESFEKDISLKKARELEEELASLRAKLKNKFPAGPVESVAKCEVRKQLEEHIGKLEKEIDARAHKAKCHKCKTENGVPRSEEAKKLILDKVAELKKLAKEEGDTPDHKLARALERIEATKDENGATGGKMLGVLICEDEEKNTVLIWAYSGTLNPESRGAGAEEARLQRLLDAPADAKKNAAELQETQKELAGNKKVMETYEQGVKEIDAGLKETNTKLQQEFDEQRKTVIEREDDVRKKAGEEQKKAIESAKAEYEKAAEKKDEGFEAAKQRYTEALKKASEGYQKIATESQERQRQAVEKAQTELKAGQEKAREAADLKKKEAAEKVEPVQELRKKETQLLKDKAELENRVKERSEQFEDESKLKEALEKASKETSLASERDTLVENSTGPVWQRPVKDVLMSKGKDSAKLDDLNHEHEGTPHGVCSAPKMIQAAYGKNLKVVAMAEAWYGGGTNTHGELVASCNTCMKNIGFQLCEEKHGK